MPVELVKSKKDEEDVWRIKGIASTPDEDLQGETINQEGLDISVLKAGRGLFNWDHQKGPENIIGQIEKAEFIENDGKRALEVEGYLFNKQPRAQAFYNIMTSMKKASAPRVHLSIEGKILERDFEDNQTIRKARVEKVALTLDPVNPYTYVDLIKSLRDPSEEFVGLTPNGGSTQEIQLSEDGFISLPKKTIQELISIAEKALSAGTGHADAPASRTGGSALQMESLESNPKHVARKKRKKMLKSIISDLTEKHPEVDPVELANYTVNIFKSKIEKKGNSNDN
jgi:hypothetical protein